MRQNRLSVVLGLFAAVLLVSCTSKGPYQESLSPHNIACVGDSITYGYKLAEPATNSYPAKLSRRSKNMWRVTNLGVNGATVASKGDIPYVSQSQYQSLQSVSPDVVVILLGTNDLKNDNWRLKDEFVADYVSLISAVSELPSQPSVIVCSVPPVLVDLPIGIRSDRLVEVNALIQEAANVSGARFLDIHSVFPAKNSFFIDGVHPNNRGTSLLADTIFSYIANM